MNLIKEMSIGIKKTNVLTSKSLLLFRYVQ